MAIYQVLPDCEVTWPDGSIRAKAGECFEGYDDSGTRPARDLAASMLTDQLGQFTACTVDPVCVLRELPPGIVDAFLFFNGAFASVEPPKQKAKKKVTAKKATPARLGDPDE